MSFPLESSLCTHPPPRNSIYIQIICNSKYVLHVNIMRKCCVKYLASRNNFGTKCMFTENVFQSYLIQKNSGVSWDIDVLLTCNRYHSLSRTLTKEILFVSFVLHVSVTQSNFSEYNAASVFTITWYKLGVINIISIRWRSFITVFNLVLSTSFWTSLSLCLVCSTFCTSLY